LKKLLFVILFSSLLFSSELDRYLSLSYKELFDLELQKSIVQGKYNSNSWVSPIMLSFERSWNNQAIGGWHPQNIYSIGIEQPIFKSGGIYYGILYAKNNKSLSLLSTIKERSKLSSSAVGILFQIKQLKLSIKKLKLQIDNAKIEIKRAKEQFDAGLVDSVFLDNALAKGDEANIALLNLKENLALLEAEYEKIGNSALKESKLPKLRVLSLDEFLSKNTDIEVAKAKTLSSKYYVKAIRSKYLPTISVGARYTKMSQSAPKTKDAFTNYSLKVTMPISINAGNEIEVAKLDSLISAINEKNSKKAQIALYKSVVNRVKLINKKIKIAKKEASAYARILKSTKSLYSAGQKSIDDVRLLKNSYKIKVLDYKIYKIDRDLELLKLYERVK
jgi:outer membrane protein TolC